MSVFVVYAPPDAAPGSPAEAERMAFVHDRFTRGIVALGPFWLIASGRWFGALVYLLLFAALAGVLVVFGVWPAAAGLVYFGLNVFMAHEEPALRGLFLELRGWRQIAVVEAQSLQDAEERFFRDLSGAGSTQTGGNLASPGVEASQASQPLSQALSNVLKSGHKVIARTPLFSRRWRHGGGSA